MAKSDAVWGIDIGNASLKALRCRPGDRPDRILADAFDYIEYPKILSQPGTEPADLIGDALKQFLSRNVVRGDRLAVSVPGQSGLARFIKLPPVEAKKIPAIVAYEARQQIPFALEDVVWDYQQMRGGMEEEGFVLETEVGLFAMKRDQVFRALEPFAGAGLEVDVVQLSPLALYNFVAFDQLRDLPTLEEYDADSPPASVVILSMGTDASDLVVTNGFRVWQRSIPLGGNHFTKALTKDLKLTFAKAEHLKRNATAAKDPKTLFQAMRPVFNDLLTEIQRSLNYFTTVDRTASIDHVLALGGPMKLPGLRKYLSQNLGYEVAALNSMPGLVGDDVTDAPAFKDHRASFGVSYGLAVQALEQGSVKTNLLPQDIVKDRMIRAKKPWAVAAVAMLLIALTISFVSISRALGKVDESVFGSSEQELVRVADKAKRLQEEAGAAQQEFQSIKQIGDHLTSNVEGRILWLELLYGINACLPRDVGERPEDISQRNEVYITNVECQKVARLEDWFAAMRQKRWYMPPGAEKRVNPAAAPDDESAADTDPGPSGVGYVVQLTGYHFHNQPTAANLMQGPQFVRETLMANLRNMRVTLPNGETGEEEVVSMKDLGIGYPALIDPGTVVVVSAADPAGGGGPMGFGGGGGGDEDEEEEEEEEEEEDGGGGRGYRFSRPRPTTATREEKATAPPVKLRRFDFRVQFVWKPTPPSERGANALAAAQPPTLAEQPDGTPP